MKITLNHKNNNGIVLINYSNNRYKNAQKINTKTAIDSGKFSKVISYSEEDIDECFFSSNKNILMQTKGGGFWLWKPYFIKKALEDLQDDEWLFYCDSGSRFINSISEFICSIGDTFDIVPFELQYIEKYWTKRDCFQLMDCDNIIITDSKQRLGGFSLWKKTDFSIQFVSEWLRYAQDERILTDIENQLGMVNYENFEAHRHDQSIFSLLTKKYKIPAYRDPSQAGNNFINLYPNSKYHQFLISTRQMDISITKKIKKHIRAYLPNIILDLYLKFFKLKFVNKLNK